MDVYSLTMSEVAADPPAGAGLLPLLDALGREVDTLAQRAAERMVSRLDSYRDLDADDVCPIVATNLRAALAALREEDGPEGERDERLREVGRVRAAQGISADDMLHAWRIGTEELRRGARAHAQQAGLPDSIVLEFTDRALAWADHGMLESAAAHRRADLDAARHEQHQRADIVRGVLLGYTPPAEFKLHALAYGLDLGADYAPFRARAGRVVGTRALEARLGVTEGAGRRHGMAAFVDGDLVGFSARIPAALGANLAGYLVGLGPSAALDSLAHPFVLATRALHAGVALGREGLLSFEVLGLRPAVLEDDDVGGPLVDAIVAPVLAQGAAGRTILATVTRFLANDRRLDVTAAELHAHVNTIRHRLQRFETLTGRSLRSTEGLVEVWWALERFGAGPAGRSVPIPAARRPSSHPAARSRATPAPSAPRPPTPRRSAAVRPHPP